MREPWKCSKTVFGNDVLQSGYVAIERNCPEVFLILGDRLVVGRETLDLVAEVRILLPQPGAGALNYESQV